MFAERTLRLLLLCAFVVAQGGFAVCPMRAPASAHERDDAPVHVHAAASHDDASHGTTSAPQSDASGCAMAMTCAGVALPVVVHAPLALRPVEVPDIGLVPLVDETPVPPIDSPPPRTLA